MHSRGLMLLTLILMSVACGRLVQPLLGKVEAMPPPPSPGLRDLRNRLDIHYHLNAPATISSSILAAEGTQWVIHSDVPRPTPGDYVLQFDGTISGPGPNERRVLPDGDYQVLLDVQAGGRRQQQQVPMSVRDADTAPPAITALALLPDRISPNYDARDDVTHMSYQLAKDARVSAFLDQTSASGSPRRVWMGDETRVLAGNQTLTWDGTANGQPVPNGDYLLGIRARDQAGNVVETARPLVVEGAGVPDAAIISAHVGPLRIIRGDQVCFEVLVRNSGTTLLRTQGPDPGYVYDSFDSYSSIENHRFAEHAGFWRIGLNWSASTDTNGATYPYRWGFGRDLQPGEDVTVPGCVIVHNDQDQLVYFVGLIQENVAIHSPGAGLVRVAISS
ncbi:MAG: hypothetical protein M3069_27075 [Chloroflexota bacterium]|nr:hypothetical protein [Chloroflexota bacterium]